MVVMKWVIPITLHWVNGRVGKAIYLAHVVDELYAWAQGRVHSTMPIPPQPVYCLGH
jgi:hypothetical protein